MDNQTVTMAHGAGGKVNVMGESKDKAKTKEKKTPFFKGLKAEFNKIIWPDKTTLTKQTAAVVVVSVILGAIITICDILVKFGVDLLVR